MTHRHRALRAFVSVTSFLVAACGAPADHGKGGPDANAGHDGAKGPTYSAGDLVVSRVYLPVPIANTPGAVYLTVSNGGAAADTLVGVTTTVAEKAELHESMQHPGS